MFARSHARMLHHELVGEFPFGYLEHEHLLGSQRFLEFRIILHFYIGFLPLISNIASDAFSYSRSDISPFVFLTRCSMSRVCFCS